MMKRCREAELPIQLGGIEQGLFIVAGGGGGIGRSIAQRCLEMGWKTLVADLDIGWWEQVHHPGLDLYRLDVLDPESIKAFTEHILTGGMRVSGVACTIGKAITKPLQAMKTTEYR